MRDFVPISHTFPAQKPLTDENGNRKAARPVEDLRVQTLKSQQQHNQQQQRQQQQQQQPPAKQPCSEGPLAGVRAAAAASGDSQIGGVFHQRSMDSAEVQPPGGGGGGGGHATDFAAFNALVRSERQQQQPPPGAGGGSQPPAAAGGGGGGGGGSFSARPPQGPKTQFQVTTFDSLTSNALPADVIDHTAQLEGIRSLYGLGGDASCTGSLPGWPLPRAGFLGGTNAAAGAPGASAAAGGAGAAATQQQQQQQKQQQPFELEGLPAAPWDWSLKTRVRVSSPRPLSCLRASASVGLLPACRIAARGGGAAAAEVLAAAAPAPAPAGVGALLAAQDAADAALSERLQAALLQWQHPERQLGADALEVMRASKSTGELLAARACAWRDALRALFAGVRNGQVPAAYVAGAQLFHQPLTVLFLAPGAVACPNSGPAAPAAVVSRSNRQLRQALDAVGGCYSMAAGNGGSESAPDPGKPQQQQQQPVGSGAAPSAADGRAGSQLLVTGARGVQALYLLLLQQPFCTGEGAGDVPVLLAPAPFAGAALCPCTFTELPGAAAAAAAAGPRRPGAAPLPAAGARHYAEVAPPAGSGAGYHSSSGGGGGGGGLLVAPWTMARLAAVLAGSEREFEVFVDSEATSSSLNLAPTLGSPWLVNGTSITPASGGALEGDAAAGGLTVAERAAWAGGGRGLAGRTVRQLRFAAGLFAARLAAP